MELLRIRPGSEWTALMDEVNLESFPPEERMDTQTQLALCGKGKLDVWAIMNEGKFVGFTTVFPYSVLVYVFFLAIHKDCRSCGYGTRALSLIAEQYPGKRVVLDIEPDDLSQPGNELRLRRKAFYLRNGFSSSGYMLTYLGLRFEILYAGGEGFCMDDYRKMMHEIYEMVCACGYKGFEPQIIPLP